MAHVGLVLLLLLGVTLLCSGTYVPPHVPMQEVGPVAEFEVPWWLGGFVAVTNETSEWVLPLTYVNGGKTNTGTTLVIQNRGPFNITLYSSDPETIQGLASYLIVADSTVQFLSATDWVVVSATFGDEGTDGSFGYLQAENVSVGCYVDVDGTAAKVGITTPVCGVVYAAKDFLFLNATSSSQVSALISGTYYLSIPGTSSASLRGYQFYSTLGRRGLVDDNSGNNANVDNSITFTGDGSLSRSSFGMIVESLAFLIDSLAFAGSIVHATIMRIQPLVSLTGIASTGTVNALYGIFINAPGRLNTNINILQNYGIWLDAATSVSSNFGPSATHNVGIMVGARSGALTINAGIWSNTDATSNILCAGASADVCLSRAAAGALTLGTGQDLRVPGYLGLGSSSAPTNTADGAFSTTKATPTLQAFGAVTASAASGTLAFTVSTAAVTCATAVVTNTNVVAGSTVILTIQSYTGTAFTNGVPTVARADTSGSSAGSFTIQLCNTHATNALSGNLFVGFWVLN